MNKGRQFVWKSHKKRFEVGMHVGWGGVSGIHQSRVKGVSQVNGGFVVGTHQCLHIVLGDGLTNEQGHLPALPFRRAALTFVPPALSLKLDNSVSHLCSWCFLSCSCSGTQSKLLCKSVCVGPFKIYKILFCRKRLSFSATNPASFHNQM